MYETIPVTGNATQWSYTVPRYWQGWQCKNLKVSFSTKANGVWSEWKTKTCCIEGPLPLQPAVIHVDELISAKTSFNISVDPVEHATYYECWIYNANGSYIWGNSYSTISTLQFNSENYESGEYTFKVSAYADGFTASSSEKTFSIAGLPSLEPAVIRVNDPIEAGKDFSITIDPVENATSYSYSLYMPDGSSRGSSVYSSLKTCRYNGYDHIL